MLGALRSVPPQSVRRRCHLPRTACSAVSVRPARSEREFDDAARVHTAVFYPQLAASPLLRPAASFLEWDFAAGVKFKLRKAEPGTSTACLLAFLGDAVVGCAIVDTAADRFDSAFPLLWPPRPSSQPSRGLAVAYLASLCVDPRFRRRGAASALLEAAQAVAAGWGCRSLALHSVYDDAPSRALYRRAGFRAVMVEQPWQQALALRDKRLVLLIRSLRTRGSAV